MKVFDIVRVNYSQRITLNHHPYLSEELAHQMAMAYARQTPIPGVIEVWEIDNVNNIHRLVKAYPGQR